MTDQVIPQQARAARAVGRIPSGLFVLCRSNGGLRRGMLVSWVQQAGFAPLSVTVAIRADREMSDALSPGERFVLNQLAAGRSDLIRRFSRPGDETGDDFQGLVLSEVAEHENWAGPVLGDAVAALHLEVIGLLAGGDHVVVLGRVLDGHVPDAQADPHVHVRRSGTHY
jgi:flavin reductase (DIM6/NTAB) family NADH-FMN oxidoreductase RutF